MFRSTTLTQNQSNYFLPNYIINQSSPTSNQHNSSENCVNILQFLDSSCSLLANMFSMWQFGHCFTLEWSLELTPIGLSVHEYVFPMQRPSEIYVPMEVELLWDLMTRQWVSGLERIMFSLMFSLRIVLLFFQLFCSYFSTSILKN